MSEYKIEQTKRLRILQEDYDINPVKAISSLIGNDVEIIDYVLNDVYFDEYVIVDVKYRQLEINPTSIFFIKDYKQLNTKKQNIFIVNVKGFNVCLNIMDTTDLERVKTNKYLAIEVSPVISITRDNNLYRYYGIVKHTPFHSCNSEIFIYSNEIDNDLSLPQKSNTNNVKLFSDNLIAKSYANLNKVFSYRSSFQEMNDIKLTRVQKITECVDKKKIYVIDVREINNDSELKGYIAVSDYREYPFDIMFIPMIDYVIDKRKLYNIKKFMLNDYEYYLEWLEKMK